MGYQKSRPDLELGALCDMKDFHIQSILDYIRALEDQIENLENQMNDLEDTIKDLSGYIQNGHN